VRYIEEFNADDSALYRSTFIIINHRFTTDVTIKIKMANEVRRRRSRRRRRRERRERKKKNG